MQDYIQLRDSVEYPLVTCIFLAYVVYTRQDVHVYTNKIQATGGILRGIPLESIA